MILENGARELGMTERSAEHVTLAKRVPKTDEAKPKGLQDAVLEELRVAAATFDYLRSTDDPVEFWEALRLARSLRGVAPGPDGALPTPDPEEDRLLCHELDLLRTRYAGRSRPNVIPYRRPALLRYSSPRSPDCCPPWHS